MAANPHPTLSLLYSFLLVYVCAQLDKILPSLLVANFHAKQQNKTISPTCMHRCVPECARTCVTAFELLFIRVCMYLFVIPRCKSTAGYKNNTPLALDLLLFGYIIMAGYPMVFNRERVYVFRHWGKKIYSRAYTSWVIHQLLERVLFCQPFLFCSGKGEKKVDTHWEREREQHPHLTYFGAAVN